MKLKLLLSIFTCTLLISKTAVSQLYEISLDEKVAKSSLIVEGKVTSQSSFWNPAHTMIFTSNKVEVYKIFKGAVTTSTIEILTQGGSVGNDYVEATDVLSLDKGEIGAFFCYLNTINLKSPATGKVLFDVYSSNQGFLKYNLSANKVSAPFVVYNDIEGNFYKLIKQKTGSKIKIINASFKAVPPKKNESTAREIQATISSFSPASVYAGALNNPSANVLTINGSGFGTATAGKQVVFKDANNTSASSDYPVESTSPYITSWADNQIVIRVPQRAATGKFGVVMAVADTSFAPTILQVPYAILNASFSSGAVSEPRLMNANNLGGYTIVYSTSTAGGGTNITTDSAYDCFRRALRTWTEMTGVNFIEGGNTTNQAVNAGDNINTIMFDNTNTTQVPVPSGTLAITYSSYSLCSGAPYGQKTGFDMVIRKEFVSTAPGSFVFNKSYCSLFINTYDLEGTLLHELGHALNLGHINDPQEQTSAYTNRNPAKLMHPTVSLSIGRKALDQSAFAGALYTVTPQNNIGYGTCRFLTEMIQTAATVSPFNDCPSTFPSLPISAGTAIPIDLDHASSNKFTDPQFTAIGSVGTTVGTGVTVTNNAYYAFRTDASGNLSFSISNYVTYPAEQQTNCTGAGQQGGRMALYQVNACPAGQAFPAPVYAATFAGNAASSITGLLANTTYLFYFDGISGTKPSFNFTFTGGSVLPIILSNFYGETNKAVNNLFVDLQVVTGNMQMILERSAEGTNYKTLGPINLQQRTTAAKYTYVDALPLNGNNYYRLKIINPDGTFEYSKVVLLKNNLGGQVLMYPNPIKDKLTINLAYLESGKYNITITDVMGRKIYSQQTGGTVVTVPFSAKANGSYIVQVMDSRNNIIATNKIVAGN